MRLNPKGDYLLAEDNSQDLLKRKIEVGSTVTARGWQIFKTVKLITDPTTLEEHIKRVNQ